MAQRRMFSKKITETDRFLEMPLSSQALYFHLNMGADDEGFIDKAKTIQRTIGASDDDMKLLIAKGFLLPFDSGVVVIRHWRIHNYIRSDRFQSTIHQDEKKQIDFDATKTANIKPVSNVIPNGYQMDTQVRLVEGSLDKVSLDYLSPVPNDLEDDIPYKEIISHLNEKANRNYKANGSKTRNNIKARWNEGFRLDDFLHVIDTMVKDWSGTKYEKYLRPETLFGPKFEGYLNQSPRINPEPVDERLGF
ncbi:TPA: phage protein [Streptococcus suis]|uniref:conserved phage C-terminal domain-containing protein n=1 Tax=Streptococcus suis TaxID=1307 RepID=UPI00211C5570|nr:conserved phage C-terminal domain-containing protein [Streptococcus suis]UUM55489.1 conserved phage C-terminal domain-containing protein [Streptococcus suis]HEL1804171.1 phage protein [Streptococcus suis]HEL2033329.1 phage protein [Streptococcus suis]HEL2632264.1 phage protein [Streptococcus suis]HEM2688616.1 phage protein [Streptococcus suis]